MRTLQAVAAEKLKYRVNENAEDGLLLNHL